jgi:hypothetical protein
MLSSAAQMRPPPSRPSLSRFAKAAISLEIFLSVGALGGGGALMLGPRGEIIPLPVSALEGSPFDTYLAPGLILFCALGLGPLVAAALAWRRHPMAPFAASTVGAALLIWLAIEIAVVGYSNEPPLQPFYLLLGVAITVVGLGWRAALRSSALRRE